MEATKEGHKHTAGCIQAARVDLLRAVVELFDAMDEADDRCIDCHVSTLQNAIESVQTIAGDFEDWHDQVHAMEEAAQKSDA